MSAVISPCGKYRYSLTREWLGGDGTCVFVMLNPSTADAIEDDPTIRRCIGFAKRLNCRALEVVNLFAFRATDPRDMFLAADPVGPDNDRHIFTAVMSGRIAIAAWGALGKPWRVAQVRRDVAACPWAFTHLGLTKAGQPRHPLYLKSDAPLEKLR